VGDQGGDVAPQIVIGVRISTKAGGAHHLDDMGTPKESHGGRGRLKKTEWLAGQRGAQTDKTADNINGRLHGTEESRLPKVFANDKVVGVLLKTKANVEDVDSRQLREEAGVGNVKTVGGVKGEILQDEG
jgi:hypothetical protein